jgi:hypothetical protein
MINALRWTLHRKYEGKYLGLQYNINKIDEFYFHTPEDLGYVYDFDYLAHAPPPTPEGYMSYFRFERNKTSNNPSESISSFVHNIHIYDSKGGDSMTIVEGNNSDDSYLSDTILDFADADILIIVLDPIMIAHQSKTDNNEFSGRITTSDYAAMVRRLFAIVEKSNPEKQRLYAVCVTKADLIKGSTYLHPDAIIETFFGSEMSEALKMPKKGIVQTFTTSSFGFLPGTTRPNFDSSSQRIVDKEHWQPYGIEYPFFWAFELEEKKLVEKLFSKSLWGKLAHRSKLLQYIPYPKPTYKT